MKRTFLALGAIALTVGTVAFANNSEKRVVPSALYVKLGSGTCQLIQSSAINSLWQITTSTTEQAQIQTTGGNDRAVFGNNNCDGAGTIERVKFD